MTPATFKRAVALCLLIILGIFFVEHATASNFCQYCEPVPGPAGPQGEPGTDGADGKNYLTEGVSDSDVRELFAASAAIAGLDFDSTTNKTQFGLSLAGFGDANNVGIGIGQVWDSDDMGDVLFSFKTVVDEVELDGDSHRPWVGAAVWKVDLF